MAECRTHHQCNYGEYCDLIITRCFACKFICDPYKGPIAPQECCTNCPSYKEKEGLFPNVDCLKYAKPSTPAPAPQRNIQPQSKDSNPREKIKSKPEKNKNKKPCTKKSRKKRCNPQEDSSAEDETTTTTKKPGTEIKSLSQLESNTAKSNPAGTPVEGFGDNNISKGGNSIDKPLKIFQQPPIDQSAQGSVTPWIITTVSLTCIFIALVLLAILMLVYFNRRKRKDGKNESVTDVEMTPLNSSSESKELSKPTNHVTPLADSKASVFYSSEGQSSGGNSNSNSASRNAIESASKNSLCTNCSQIITSPGSNREESPGADSEEKQNLLNSSVENNGGGKNTSLEEQQNSETQQCNSGGSRALGKSGSSQSISLHVKAN